MQRFDLVEKIKTAEDQVLSLHGDLRTFLRGYIDANRKYKDGQKVEVFDEVGKSIGVGYIKSAQCGVSLRWGFRPSEYIGKEDKWLEDLNDIMYEVVKAKKDGTQSSRSLMWEKARQVPTIGRFYLKPIE